MGCEIAKFERVQFYKNCYPPDKQKFVNIEGPEFNQDYSYFLVDMQSDMGNLE